MNHHQRPGNETRPDLARLALRAAREDVRTGRAAKRTPIGRLRARGRTPPVALSVALLELFAPVLSPLPVWNQVAGDDLSKHIVPTSFDSETGTLTLIGTSVAWLTLTRVLTPALMQKLNEVLGEGTVRRIRIARRTFSPALPLPPVPGGLRTRREERVVPPDPGIEAALNRQARQLPRGEG